MGEKLYFEELTSTDIINKNKYTIIDVNSEQLKDKEIPIITSEYNIYYWLYNDTKCYISVDKKDPSRMWVIPVKDRWISSDYGWRYHPLTGKRAFHAGIDLPGKGGSPILAARAGVVTEARYNNGSGHYVTIQHYKDNDVNKRELDGFVTKYLHMGPATKQKVNGNWENIPGDADEKKYRHIVKEGQIVREGQIIGAIGTSGSSTGNHLHFELIVDNVAVNPAEYMNINTAVSKDISKLPVIRVQKDSPTHDDFVPMFSYKNENSFLGGSLYQHHIRRGNIIGDSSVSIFDLSKEQHSISAGSSCIGPARSVMSIAAVPSKEDIEALYWDNNTNKCSYEGGFYLPNNSDSAINSNCIKIAKYIYSKMTTIYGWTPEAALALLGNMYGESGLNPARHEMGGTGFGLIGWTPGDTFKLRVRKDKFPNGTPAIYTDEYKQWEKAPYDIDIQLEYVAKMETWSNSYSPSGYYANHIKGYLDNISPSNPADVKINIFTSYSSHTEVTFKSEELWKDYYVGDSSEIERRKVYNELRTYYDRGKVFNISKAEFKAGRESIGTLTVIYAINGEKPHHYALKPWVRINAAYSFKHYIGVNFDMKINMDLDDPNFDSTTNPYTSLFAYNNAYCWGKAMKILDVVKNDRKYDSLCKNHQDNWYEYNRVHKIFDYGMIPRKYAIACWKYTGYDRERTRTAIVEEVLGTDIITISEYPHKSYNYTANWGALEIVSQTITNPDSNWEQDKSLYKFLGFIYLLDNSELNTESVIKQPDGSITVFSNINTPYSTISFGTVDIKHYNRVRLIFDVNVYNLLGNEQDLSGSICIMASQQILNCVYTDDDWYETGFNPLVSYDNHDTYYHNYPFPNGAIQLSRMDIKELVNKGTLSYDTTFKLNQYSINGKAEDSFKNDSYLVLKRDIPLYISVTPISYEGDSSTNSATVEVTIKKILLYR